jgi:hypothetical protein
MGASFRLALCRAGLSGLVVSAFTAVSGIQAQSTLEQDIARVREATAAFRSLDSAVAAGYGRDGGGCVERQPAGAMGFHHQNDALMDDRLELLRPEILVYERLPAGEYRLNGVEYIVPFSAWPESREPPTILSQPLKPFPALGIWYLHVWVWLENPSGLFADYNPRVRCPGRPAGIHDHEASANTMRNARAAREDA